MPYFANGTQISEEDLRMLLVVDVGNTNIVAGVFDDKTLKVHWRFSTDRSKTADEFGIMLNLNLNLVQNGILKLGKIIQFIHEKPCWNKYCSQ